MSRGIHAPFSRLFVLSPSTPKTSGGSFDLGDGQLGLFIASGGSVSGAVAVNDFSQLDKQYFLEVGTGIDSQQGGMSSKGLRTHVFSPKDILDVTWAQPKPFVLSKIYLGYDGFDTSKTLKLKPGEAAEISLTLTGEPLSYYGFKDRKYTATFTMKADDPDECQETCLDSPCYERTKSLIEIMKNRQVRNGVLLKDIIDIHPVIDCDPQRSTTNTATFYTLEICDKGDDQALGLVQAQTPGYKVVRIGREDGTSTYQVIGTSSPSAYTDWQAAFVVDCDGDCPDGSTDQGSGWQVVIKYPDNNTDASATIKAASAATFGTAADTVSKLGGGVNEGTYIIIWNTTEPDQSAFSGVFTITDVVAFDDGCLSDTVDQTAWVAGDSCQTAFNYYYIDLEDDDCGSRLAELRSAFPSLTIVEAAALAGGVPDGTDLTEVSDIDTIVQSDVIGDCRRRYFTQVTTNVVCDECHPDEFVSEAPQGFEFEEWKAWSNTGGGIGSVSVPTATNDDGTYTGVSGVSSADGVGAKFDIVVASGVATVTIVDKGTNFQVSDTITIDDADLGDGGGDDLVVTVTSIVEPEEDVDCVCGIMFRGKDLYECPETYLADEVGTIKSQIEIQVSGGEKLGDRIGYAYKTDGAFPVTQVSRAFDGTGWGKEYWEEEKISYDYGLAILPGETTQERYHKGTQSKLETCSQYATVTVKVKNSALSQAFSQTKSEEIRYNFVIKKGTESIYESFFDTLSAQIQK